MDGRRALVYARIRENTLDPSESDITRGGRQQQVVQAIADETVSLHAFLRLPFVGDDLVTPLATDLSAWDLMQLGWVKFRAAEDGTLRCRLGGTGARIGDGSYIVGVEENVAVVAMFEGKSAPQPPSPGGGPFAPGCEAGGASP
jgi:anionic cell wall polymer biosynthesis LytR-Cps2A-Psr (LCP) family protein